MGSGPCACPQSTWDETTATGKLDINSQMPAAPQEKNFMVEDDKSSLNVVSPHCWGYTNRYLDSLVHLTFPAGSLLLLVRKECSCCRGQKAADGEERSRLLVTNEGFCVRRTHLSWRRKKAYTGVERRSLSAKKEGLCMRRTKAYGSEERMRLPTKKERVMLARIESF